MLYGILLIALLLGFLVVAVYLLKKSPLLRGQKITWGVLSVFSWFGFFIAVILLYSMVNPNGFRLRLGHYLMNKFSTPQDTIGRLTLQNANGTYEVFPKNKEQKPIGIYSAGQLRSGTLSNGQVTVEPGNDMRVGLGYLLFGK